MKAAGVAEEPEIRRWVRELQSGIAVEKNGRRIFHHYYEWVRGFLGRRGFSPQETEDLAQDTFLLVFHRLSTYREENDFNSWLFAVAANVVRNHHRSRVAGKRTGQEVSLTAEDGGESVGSHEVVDEREDPGREILNKERQMALQRAVEDLPPQMRRCFLLRHERELKYREIAVLMKLSLETVKAHLFNARHRLKETLGDNLEAET